MAKAKGRGVMSVVNTRMKADLFQLVQLVQTMMDPELVGIAAINSSSQFILSGDLEQILKIEDKLKENPDVLKVQRLQGVSCAFHSPFMREVAEEFKVEAKVLLEQIKPDPAIPVISNYTAMEVS